MSSEISNSALETLADGIHPEQSEKVGAAKDKAAGHVLVDAIISVIIGLIIFAPKVYALLI
jgi:diacylglycerol kinase